MRDYFGGPPGTLTLSTLYAESDAGETGPGLANGTLALPPVDLDVNPPGLSLESVAWYEGDTQLIWGMADQVAAFYDRYLTELNAYRAALPARPATIMQQMGVSPDSLRDPTGSVLLSIDIRNALRSELLYLIRADEAWRTIETDIVTNLLPRRQEIIMLLLARRAAEYQTLARIEAGWETEWREKLAPWANAGFAEREEIRDEISAVYDVLNGPFNEHADCALSQDSLAHGLIAEISATRVPPNMIYRNPALSVSHLGGRMYSPPLDRDGFYEALRSEISTPPDCGIVSVIPAAPASEPLAGLPAAPSPIPCPDCDDAKIALQAAEMTLFPLLREQSRLADTLSRGRDADALLQDYVTALSAAENYASEIGTQMEIDGNPLTGAKSTLDFWLEVLKASYPSDNQLMLLRELANRCPVLLILAKLGVESAVTQITTGVCGRRAYNAAFGGPDPWAPEAVAERLASAPPDDGQRTKTFDELVQERLFADPRMAELNAAAASAKLTWERRFAYEARKQQVDTDVAELEAERLMLKASLEDCIRQCRMR
jgi:hypothetical protein